MALAPRAGGNWSGSGETRSATATGLGGAISGPPFGLLWDSSDGVKGRGPASIFAGPFVPAPTEASSPDERASAPLDSAFCSIEADADLAALALTGFSAFDCPRTRRSAIGARVVWLFGSILASGAFCLKTPDAQVESAASSNTPAATEGHIQVGARPGLTRDSGSPSSCGQLATTCASVGPGNEEVVEGGPGCGTRVVGLTGAGAPWAGEKLPTTGGPGTDRSL